MGKKHREQVEKRQKDALKDTGVTIIAVDEKGQSPFDIIEGIHRLKAGEFVSLTGDRTWHPDQRTVTVRFLDNDIELPVTPHVLALLTQKPIFIFSPFASALKNIIFIALPPLRSKPKIRLTASRP